jgi:hypothetical protein
LTDDLLDQIATFVAVSGAVPALGFTLVYGLGSPWYRSALGIVMFLLGLTVVIAFVQIISHRLFGSYPGYGHVSLAAYILIVADLWALLVMVIIERRKPKGTSPLFVPPTSKGKK